MIAPTVEALTMAEAKQHLLISDSDTNHDPYVASAIEASREEFEHDTQALTVARAIGEWMFHFPSPEWTFYYRPIAVVNAISYYDVDNNLQQLPHSTYSVDEAGRHIYLAPGESWPITSFRWDAVHINYSAGYEPDKIPETMKAALKLKLNELFELRGLAPNQTTEQSSKAYELMVQKYARSDYP